MKTIMGILFPWRKEGIKPKKVMKRASDFTDMMQNCDPDLALRTLQHIVPGEVKDKVVRYYNKRVDVNNRDVANLQRSHNE